VFSRQERILRHRFLSHRHIRPNRLHRRYVSSRVQAQRRSAKKRWNHRARVKHRRSTVLERLRDHPTMVNSR
jgi:hypothetical protein